MPDDSKLEVRPILIDGEYRPATGDGPFQAVDPTTGNFIGPLYPICSRKDLSRAVAAGADAAGELRDLPSDTRARFLVDYADRIDAEAEAITQAAHEETALPLTPRLRDGELPRTSNQLRQAAAAVRQGSWQQPTIDTAANIRSKLAPLGGPVVIFSPNNFPLAFNSVSGGDFAAAVGAGNPVIAKAHPNHPRTTELLAEQARLAMMDSGMPPGSFQLLYQMDFADGDYLVSRPDVGAVAYTGSRRGGMRLKAAADQAGVPIYLELSSVNPVFVLPGAGEARGEAIVEEFAGSALMGTGQFCTNPGIVVLEQGEPADRFIDRVKSHYESTEPTYLLAPQGVENLAGSVEILKGAGAELLTGGSAISEGCRFQNTLLKTTGEQFLNNHEELQTEAFGNASLIVVAEDVDQMADIAESFEGNLTGCIYSAEDGSDDASYEAVAKALRPRVGRLLNDKMPTGVAVTASMHHGGPYPSTGHPGFTGVGIPASLRRFAMLECYDNVRQDRLPAELQDKNPTGNTWRLVDGAWTTADI